MADYTATARTNYFHVRDEDALRAELTRHGITVHDWDGYGGLVLDHDEDDRVGLFSLCDLGTWPHLCDDDTVISNLAEGVACNRYGPANGVNGLCEACGLSVVQHTNSAPYYESVMALVSAHLAPDEVAVFMEVGSEKMRYLAGSAIAVNAHGHSEVVELEDIYEKARSLGSNVTSVHY